MRIKTKGMTLHVEPDDYPPNPREQGSVARMLCWHRRYNLGDKNPYAESGDFYDDKELQADIFVMRKFYMLDHSGLRFSASPSEFRAVDPYGFDWGAIGVIYITMDNAQRVYGDLSDDSKQKADQELIDEIKEFDRYHNTQYYGYFIEDGEGETLDASGGYYGDSMTDILEVMRDCAETEYHPLFDKALRQQQSGTAM
jgi:hypothetical protein